MDSTPESIRARAFGILIATLLALVVPVGTATPMAGADSEQSTDPFVVEHLERLAGLEIKGRAPKTGYDRSLFGTAWSDDVTVPGGHNGCDTRNDILRRDLVDIVFKPGTRDCVVLTGVLHDPYTGNVIDFQRGRGTSRAVQIDHIVALADAWQKGAQQWDDDKRRNFANDPLNLQAVDGPANQRKKAGDAATWLPPNKPYRCVYVARIVDVKSVYGLWVTPAEHDAIARILTRGCAVPAPPEEEPLPPPDDEPDDAAPIPEESEAEAPPPPPPGQPPPLVPAPVPAPLPLSGPVYFPNCTAARAAGAAPIYLGQPGYRPALDGDGDGIACE